MAGAFLYRNHVTQGVGISSSVASTTGLPLSNLIDDQPRTRARFNGIAGATGFYASLIIDLLGQVEVDCVALISTTIDSTTAPSLVRVRLSTEDETGVTGDAWDTGTLFAETSPAANGNVVFLRDAGPATGRYLLIETGSNRYQQIDIGRVVAGPLWRLEHAHAYGIEEGRLSLDRRDRNALTGTEFAVPGLYNPRTASFTLPYLTTAEATGEHREMVRIIGAAGEVLWIPELALSRSELNLRSLWGAHVAPGGVASVARVAHLINTRSFRITERV